MSSDSFDPDLLLNATITEAEYEGKKSLTPVGTYPDCTITSVRAFEPHEKAKEKGIEARFLVVFDCASFDGDLSTFINYKRPLNSKATYTKLLKAIWPDKKVALTKTPRDFIGEKVNVSVFHEDGDFGEWAEFRFTSAR
jgi:hypothetical protein